MLKKESTIVLPQLRAAAYAVRIPVTISFQLSKIPFELTGGTADLNKQPFLSTITYAGYVSDYCVGGTESIEDDKGNVVGPMRIFIPVNVMEKRVKELIGKSVFAADSLDTHDNTVQVGQFLDAYMDRVIGTEIHSVHAPGFFDKKTNPELIAKIIERARNHELGFSYDLKNAPGHLDTSIVPGETILVLDDFEWRGATVLHSNRAAYFYTNLAAKKLGKPTSALTASGDPIDPTTQPAGTSTSSTPFRQPTGETDMTKEELAAALAAALSPLSTEITKLTAGQTAIEARFVKLETATAELKAAGSPQKTPAQIEAERLAAEAAGKPATMTAEQLAAAVATATTTAVTAALKAAGIVPDATGKGKQATFTAAELQTVKRWGGEGSVNGDGDLTIDGLTAAIHAVNDNAALTADGKIRALDVLVPMRTQLQKEAMGVN